MVKNIFTGVFFTDEKSEEGNREKLARITGYSNLGIVELATSPLTGITMEELPALVPEDFLFAVCAPTGLSRKTRDEKGSFIRDEVLIDTFFDDIAPLIENEKLYSVTITMPYRFGKNDETVNHLKWLVGAMKERAEISVSFMNPDWNRPSTIELLKEYSAGFTPVDGPNIPQFPSLLSICSSQSGLMRLYGKNLDWFDLPDIKKFDYLYNESELYTLSNIAKQMRHKSGQLALIFANLSYGKAESSARMLADMIGDSGRSKNI